MDGANVIPYIIQNNIEGAIVECGVESGKFEIIWINELLKRKEVRDIYLYDTFEGLTEPGENDFTCEGAVLYNMSKDAVYKTWKSYKDSGKPWCSCSLEKVKKTLESTGYPKDKLHYIKGDVSKTLLEVSNIPEKISCLRLDTDWYESSKIELEKLYDNVVPGGVIIFDDYFHWDGQRKATDEFFNSRGIKHQFVRIDVKTAAIIKTRIEEMKLTDLINNLKTDKNTTHSYLDLYETLFEKKRHTAKNVLEIGIGNFGTKNGGSIKLWRDYFSIATIYGLDILDKSRVMSELLVDSRIILHTSTNAYDKKFVSETLSSTKFDIMLDDGPHTLESMIDFITLYSPLVAEDGILIIEDVQSMDWLDKLVDAVPKQLQGYIRTYDLRANKGRYDDIVFTIDKSQAPQDNVKVLACL